jgi:hypothetical protein
MGEFMAKKGGNRTASGTTKGQAEQKGAIAGGNEPSVAKVDVPGGAVGALPPSLVASAAAAAPQVGGSLTASSPPPPPSGPTQGAAASGPARPNRDGELQRQLDELKAQHQDCGARIGRAEAVAVFLQGELEAEKATRDAAVDRLQHALADIEFEKSLLGEERKQLGAAVEANRAQARALVAEESVALREAEELARDKRRAAEEKARQDRWAELDAALHRRRQEVEAQLKVLQQQANEAEARLARAVAAGQNAHEAAAAERERALAQREAQALEDAEEVIDEARTTGEELRARAVQEAHRIVDEARARAATLWEEARQKVATDRESVAADLALRARKAADEAAQALKAAEQKAAELRGEADRGRQKAESVAAQTIASAQLEADLLRKRAQDEAAEIVARAALTIDALRRDRLALAESEEARLAALSDALDQREKELRGLEATLRGEKARLERRAQTLGERESDLDLDQRQVNDRRDALNSREARLGASRVAVLEQELEEMRQRNQTLRDHSLAIAAERDRVAKALDDLGGANAAARVDEVERLRKQVSSLQVELSQAAHTDDVARLQREVDHLRHFRERALAVDADRQRLELSQMDIDTRVGLLRAEAERAARARDTALNRVKELEDERGHLEVSIAEKARAEGEIKALRLDRDWLDQERQRLMEQLQIRRDAVEESMRRRYGRIALYDSPDGPLQELIADQKLTKKPLPANGIDLATLAGHIQRRMADHRETDDDRGRRYRIDDVRSFIACLATSRMLVLKGLSGTGKTSLPLYAARALGGVCGVVKVQSGWRDRMDLVGTYNAFTEELRSQPFSELLYAASCDELRDRPFFIVLDECNLSRVEYYFADLLSELQEPKNEHRLRLLERAPGDKYPRHLSQGVELKIPRNVWFILTANEDESTFELADKTFDRSAVLQMDEQAPRELDGRPNGSLAESVSARAIIDVMRKVSARSLAADLE